MLIENGILLGFADKTGMRRLGSVPTGRLTLDGRSLAKLDGEALRARRRMATNGSALISLVLGRDGSLLADPPLSVRGLAEEIAEGRVQDPIDWKDGGRGRGESGRGEL